MECRNKKIVIFFLFIFYCFSQIYALSVLKSMATHPPKSWWSGIRSGLAPHVLYIGQMCDCMELVGAALARK